MSNTQRFVVFTDFPTIPDPNGNRNSHGDIRRVRVCDCPRVVQFFNNHDDADRVAANTNHAVVLPVRSA